MISNEEMRRKIYFEAPPVSAEAITRSIRAMTPDRVWRGCVWFSGERCETSRWLDGFARGSETGGRLGSGILTSSVTSVDALCCQIVARFCEVARYNRPLSVFSQLTALDGAPWEIHCIEDTAAYLIALESYRAQSSLQTGIV